MNARHGFAARCRWTTFVAVALTAVGLVASSRSAEKPAEPTAESSVHTEKVAGTPHFYQGDLLAGFPGDGRNYCCPVAVSDSFVYLASHGFPKLLPAGVAGAADPAEAQIALIRKLAS